MKFVYFLLAFTIAVSSPYQAFSALSTNELSPLTEHSKTTAEIVSRLKHQHFQRTSISLNDDLSATVFDRYLQELDKDRSYFLASDIAEFEKYRLLLDDALKTGNLQPAFHIFNRYHQRLIERLNFLVYTLDKGISKLDFTKDETLLIDRKDQPWLQSMDEMNQLWNKRLKNDVLSLKLSGKKTEKIQEVLSKRYNNQLTRLKQTESEDAYRIYINALTLSYDPHTQYFSPRATENFNIQMKLSLEGIGAMLQTEEEYTKVTRVIPAGPADKGGQLKANDKIIAVGQDSKGELVDVIGWRIDDVVDLIRGPKDSTVRLEIIPGNSANDQQTKIISIIRDTVKLEEQAASKKIIDLENAGQKYKLGVIDIPKFYIDFDAASRGDPDYRSTTRDVHKLINELNKENIDGLIIDLRDNGGGSLREVNELIGLFITEGPTVQVKNTSGRIYINNDEDASIAYTGPLAVLVNRLSASASEIFAGAIQDYRRGLVVGTQTYGKGTVQAMMPLNRGQITLTQQKFYRVSGNSTQNRGVLPDITLPSLYDINEIGENTLDRALPWDFISPARYQQLNDFSTLLPQLQQLHEQRSSHNPDFSYLIETSKIIEQRRHMKEVSLNESRRKKERDDLENKQLVLENKRRLAKGEKAITSIKQLDKDEDENAAENDEENDKTEALLTETGYILIDYLTMNQPKIAKH
ncbi:MAG: carboxy terminal-processing peptidase [Gammaproteobacteria bacterium]|nr:carboxy terminal-processing peptidase [Gammaproteobacteria bacterium]